MTSKQRNAKQRKSTKTGVKARGKHWAATSVDMHVASELLTAITDARGRHSTGRTTGAQERLVLVIRAAVNTNYAKAEKSFKAQGGA